MPLLARSPMLADNTQWLWRSCLRHRKHGPDCPAPVLFSVMDVSINLQGLLPGLERSFKLARLKLLPALLKQSIALRFAVLRSLCQSNGSGE